MKELNRKVFIIIYSILSLFLLFFIITYNIETYKKEYDGIYRNLTFVESKDSIPDNNFQSTFKPIDQGIDNMMIMDYEVYTVILENNTISRIIYHSNLDTSFDIEKVSNIIINKEKGLKIGNLYTNKYAYNNMNDSIIVINTEKINNKLVLTFIKSLIILVVVEILIYITANKLTKKVTKPAEDSFNKQKDFIADASHELKTPLAVIMASADELKIDKKNQKYIENIKYETDRMNTLIKGLLDLSKLENGVSISTYKEENISNIIEKTCLTFEGIAYENNNSIKTNIEEDIIFKCSREEIEKLISIILDNAIKHSYKNKKIEVKVYKEKNNINIEISNTGDPIKEGDEEKIFERFYRADKSRKRDSNRYGLGLAIAKNIVTNHNGTIKAYSKNNLTTFKIILKK